MVPGQHATVTVTIDTDEELASDHLSLELVAIGKQFDPDEDSPKRTQQLCRLVADRPIDELRTGRTSFDFAVEIPANAPASFNNELTRCDWTAKVHLSVDWAFDVHESYPVYVSKLAVDELGVTARNRAWTRDDGAPMIEYALGSQPLVPGCEFEIRTAFSMIAPHNILQIDLRLLTITETTGFTGVTTSIPVETHQWCLHRSAPRDGAVLRNTLRLPKSVDYSVSDALITRRHELAITVVTEAAEPIVRKIPIVIEEPEAPLDTFGIGKPKPKPPVEFELIGEERVREAWAAIEREISRRAGSNATVDAARQRAKILLAKSEVVLEERPHPVFGRAIVAELTSSHRGLGLDVSVEPSTADSRDARLFDTGPHERCRSRSREPAQIAAALSPTLKRLIEEADDFTMSDVHLRLWWAPHELRAKNVPAMFATLDALVDEFDRFESRTRAPAKLEHLVDRTRAFVARNDCTLTIGDMSVTRWLVHGRELSLAYRFDAAIPGKTTLQFSEPLSGDRRPSDEDVRWVAQQCRREVTLSDDRWTMEIPSVLSVEECEPIASHFAQSITLLTQRERGPYR